MVREQHQHLLGRGRWLFGIGTGKPVGRLLLVPVVVLLVLGSASPAAAETTAEVETPVAGFYRANVETVLLVTVSADQAITGTIMVESQGEAGSTTTVDIEVPGGSSKEFAVPLLLDPWAGPPTVSVRSSDGTPVRRPVVELQQVGDVEPVAVMPSLLVPGLAERIDLATDLGQGRLLPFDPAHLDFGPAALSAASAVVASESDLVNLSSGQLDALLAWVSSGGSLYLDGSVADFEAGAFGESVQATGARFVSEGGGTGDILGRAWLGAGSINVTGDALRSGRYDGLLKPRLGTPNVEEGKFVDPGEILSDLSADAGLRTRPIGPYVAVLLGYILVVGPILWLVLSRSRREPLMWLAVPVLAIAVSLAIWGAGAIFRQGTSGSHVTVTGSFGLASHTVSDYLLASSGGGFTGVRLADGWTHAPNNVSPWDWRFQQTGFATPTVQGSRIGADVPPAGVVTLGALTRQPVDQSWSIEASVDGSNISGTVTNRTGFGVESVLVFSGDQVAEVNALTDGETAAFELTGIAAPGLWDNPVQMRLARGGGRERAVSPAALDRWMSVAGLETRSGQLTVIGWTKESPAPLVTLTGSPVDRGRTGFVSSFVVSQLDGADGNRDTLDAASIRTRVLDIRWSEEIGGGMVAQDRRGPIEGEVQTMRFDLPPGTDTERLVLDVPEGVSALDLWVRGRWADAGIGRAGAGRVLVRLPSQSIIGGTVFLRVMVQPPDQPPQIRLVSGDDLDDALEITTGTAAESDGGG